MESPYYGEDLDAYYERSIGCEIFMKGGLQSVVVRSLKDAEAIHECLGRLIETLKED